MGQQSQKTEKELRSQHGERSLPLARDTAELSGTIPDVVIIFPLELSVPFFQLMKRTQVPITSFLQRNRTVTLALP